MSEKDQQPTVADPASILNMLMQRNMDHVNGILGKRIAELSVENAQLLASNDMLNQQIKSLTDMINKMREEASSKPEST